MRQSIRVAALLFGSGFCALVYQTVWLRQFRLIFGASTAATAAVLAIFLGGLGIGSALLGRRADAKDKPLAFYGRLEIAIAISAALTPLLLYVARAAYLATGGSTNVVIATVARLILALLVLGLPTALMGGTLPAAARAVESSEDGGRRRLALLYGMNTLGAVAGTIVSTFYLLEHLGNRNTLLLAAAVNVVVGVIAIVMDRGAPHPALGATLSPPQRGEGRRLVFAAAFLTGFAFLVMELVWYRMLSPVLGGTTFMFGLILAIALAGIGIGGALYSVWGRAQATAGGFALTCAIEALAMIIPFALGDELAMLAVVLRPAGVLGFGGYLIGWTIVTAIVVFPAALIAGVQFPLLISLLGRGGEHVGRDVGMAYAWNTAGAIAGSLLGGFLLIPSLTAPGSWRLAVFLLAALSAVVLIETFRARRFAIATLALMVALLAVVATRATGPTAAWRHSGIGASRFAVPGSLNEARDRIAGERRTVVWETDGRESSVALVAVTDLGLIINGKSDGSARNDAPTQIMGGMLPALLHPAPRKACVIGLGTGTTAGWLSVIPAMQRVDVIEIEPAVVEAASMYAPVNRDALRRPNVHVRIADAREVLLTTSERYDVIFSEPSNPYRAGVASLYTREFYAAARERLERGGVFAQWLQTYAVDATTIRTVYATMRTAFPHVETWWTTPGDLLLVATREPIVYDIDALRARLRTPAFRDAAHAAWRVHDVEGVLSHMAASSAFAVDAARGAALNTDDRTTIEFSFARSIASASFRLQDLLHAAERTRRSRPERVRGAVDWDRVAQSRSTNDLQLTGDPRERFAGLYSRGNLRAAAALFLASPWPIVNGREHAHVAMALAEVGDERAVVHAHSLRLLERIEADAIVARFLLRRRLTAQAAANLERALIAYRTNPWPLPDVMRHALDTATEIATADRSHAPALFAALEKPFANLLLDDERRARRLAIAVQIGECSPAMIAALEELEPHVPWHRPTLQRRATCYSGEARDRAKDDLAKYDAAEPQRFR